MNHIRKLLALLLSALLLLTPASAGYYEAFRHSEVPFDQMVYTGIDVDAVSAFCDRFVQEPAALYPDLLALYDEIYTQNELAYITMCQRPGDEAAADEAGRAGDAFADASDRIYSALSEALSGSDGVALAALMPEGQSEGFTNYAPLSDKDSASMSAEDELIRRYYLLPEDEDYADAAGEVYLRLASLRRTEAERAGFDSYPEYAYYTLYGREYEPADMRALQRVVKDQLAPLLVRCYESSAALPDDAPPADEELLGNIAARIGEISPELNEAMEYLLRNRLYRFGTGEELLDMGYTAALPAYRAAFIFNCADTAFRAYKDTVHEFGHFNAAYHDPTPMLYQLDNSDVAEIQSQGLELLFLPFLQDILADSEQEHSAVAVTVLGEMLDSIVSGCLYDEFEQTVYASPELTVDGLHALEQKLLKEYKLTALFGTEPGWFYINHLFDRPCYYISYATSALAALDIWLMSLHDRDAAVDTYLKISAARTDAWLFDVLYDNGLCDPTDRNDLKRLASELTREIDPTVGRATPRAVWYGVGGVAILGAILVFRRGRSSANAESFEE